MATVNNPIDGTAKFGWGPEDPVDEGQLELRGVVGPLKVP